MELSVTLMGRIFLGCAIAGIGLIHFFIAGFRPDILPLSPETTPRGFLYIVGAVLTVCGAAIATNSAVKKLAFGLAVLLFLFLVFGHLQFRLNNHPGILATWTPTVKLLALIGGLLVLSALSARTAADGATQKIYSLARYGKYLFAIQLLIFGIDHFLYAERLQNVVPEWLPARIFWVYATGTAMIASSLAIFINFRVQAVTALLAIMFFLWLLIVHVPSIFKNPFNEGELAVSLLQCLAACGISLLIHRAARIDSRQSLVSQTRYETSSQSSLV